MATSNSAADTVSGSLNAGNAVGNNNALVLVGGGALLLGGAIAIYCSDPAANCTEWLDSLSKSNVNTLIDSGVLKNFEELVTSSSNKHEDDKLQSQLQANHHATATPQAATGAPQIEPPDPDDEAKNKTHKTSIDHLVRDKNGNFVGEVHRGATENIRTVSRQQFQQIKNSLLRNADKEGYYSHGRGTWYRLPDGNRVGVRTSAEYGETLDFNVKGLPRDFKIHQK